MRRVATFLFLSLCLSVVRAGHLFGSGPAALSWDSDELTRVRALHKRTFDDAPEFARASNLAAYLGLDPVDGIHLPIPLNVVLIGFEGGGRGRIELRGQELQEWFATLDHILPHTRVPLRELTCKEDGMCMHFDVVQKPKPLKSYVHYNVSVHAVEVTPELAQQFTALLEELRRPEVPDTKLGRGQIDTASLEEVVDGMLAELGILWSYNIIFVNPDLTSDYVYRAGFSKAEIDVLTQDVEAAERLKKLAAKFVPRLPIVPGRDKAQSTWHPFRQHQKFDAVRLVRESEIWSDHIKGWIEQRHRLLQKLPRELEPYRNLVAMKGIHEEATVAELFTMLSRNVERRSDITAMGGLRVMEPEEGCGLDMWAGHRRWILIDFTAMPVDWGPFAGGDGAKTTETVPSTGKYFFEKPEKLKSDASARLREELKIRRDRQMEDLHAYKVEGQVPTAVLRSAEMDLLHRFHSEHCAQTTEPPLFCDRVQSALRDLGSNEDLLLTKTGDALFMEWFGMDEDVEDLELEHSGRMRDLFLAHASALVSKAIRHVFIPPTLTWKHDESLDMSTPFAKSVTFRLYLLTDAIRDPKLARRPFETEFLKKELMELKLEKQEFKFVVRHQNILDDPVLATSLAASLRTSTLESAIAQDLMQSEERLYFDSLELRELLTKRLFAGESPQKRISHEGQQTQLEVPIFLLILDRDRPIFVDRHYVARALEDMVIVVQNSQFRGQHPLGMTCGGGIAGQTLATPLKATLAAVLQHLGGILPSHLGYSPEHGAIAHDWTWTLGSNPFSLTSPGWRFSQAQKDALHRTYLLDSVDLSVDMVNSGIDLLQSVSPSDRGFELVQQRGSEIRSLLKDFSTLVELWRRIVADAGSMEFDRATTKLPLIEATAERFLEVCQEVATEMEPLKCQGAPSPIWGVADEVIGGVLFLAICVVLYRFLPKKRKRKNV